MLVDVSDSDIHSTIRTVYDVLESLGAMDKKILTVFNKQDLNQEGLPALLEDFAPAVAISASQKTGLNEMLSAVASLLK